MEDTQNLLNELIAAEKVTTQGEWHIRAVGNDFFIERVREGGEAYGVEIMSDGDYETKRADAEFIVLAKRLARAFNTKT